MEQPSSPSTTRAAFPASSPPNPSHGATSDGVLEVTGESVAAVPKTRFKKTTFARFRDRILNRSRKRSQEEDAFIPMEESSVEEEITTNDRNESPFIVIADPVQEDKSQPHDEGYNEPSEIEEDEEKEDWDASLFHEPLQDTDSHVEIAGELEEVFVEHQIEDRPRNSSCSNDVFPSPTVPTVAESEVLDNSLMADLHGKDHDLGMEIEEPAKETSPLEAGLVHLQGVNTSSNAQWNVDIEHAIIEDDGSVKEQNHKIVLSATYEGLQGTLNQNHEETCEKNGINGVATDLETVGWKLLTQEPHSTSTDAPGSDKTLLATSKSLVATEPDIFLCSMKQKSESRLQNLELGDLYLTSNFKDETKHLATELEVMQKLDMKLQQLEQNQGPSTCSSRYALSGGSKGVPLAVICLRDERKKWKRQQLLKKTLDKLDPMQTSQNHEKHMLRNIRLGPNARYFTLTEEEELLVEDLLMRPDAMEEDTTEGNSTSSGISTGFDVDGEDALRMVEIDEKLEQFIEIHSACGTPSLASATLSISKQYSVCSQENYELKGGSFVLLSSNGGVETRLAGGKSFTSTVEDYLAEKKERREYQARVEIIDKRLRELVVADAPTHISQEDLSRLISECKKEQNLETRMRPPLYIKT